MGWSSLVFPLLAAATGAFASLPAPLRSEQVLPSDGAAPNVSPDALVSPTVPAVAFDIDGVMTHGGAVCSEAIDAMKAVMDARIPFLFMTNGGGGRTEGEYATHLEHLLNEDTKPAKKCWTQASESNLPKLSEESEDDRIHIGSDRMVLSYTPFNSLETIKDGVTLVIGNEKVMNVVSNYGFSKAIHINEYSRQHSAMDTYARSTSSSSPFCANFYGSECNWNEEEHSCAFPEKEEWENVENILVVVDPNHFGQAIQVVVDVLLSGQPGLREVDPAQTPIYFSSNDLLWKADFAHARFGLGGYKLALESLYKARLSTMGFDNEAIESRMEGTWIQYGKPEVRQYEVVEAALNRMANNAGVTIGHFYMVGDNPASDMQGAVNADAAAAERGGPGWSGVLVRTGVWQPGQDTRGATYIANAVDQAVTWILNEHSQVVAEHA